MEEDYSTGDYKLGSYDAWNEYEQENLQHNFLPIKPYSQISDEEWTFLCGRRGSGKSAIALMLVANSSSHYKEAIEGEAQQYGAYMSVIESLMSKRYEGVDVDIKQAVKRLWSWVLPVKCMQLILQDQIVDEGAPNHEDRAIRHYFNTLPQPLSESSTIGQLLSNTFKIAFKILESEGVVGFDTYLVNLVGNNEFAAAMAALRVKTAKHKMLIVVDTLESYKIYRSYMIEGLQGVLEAIIAFYANPKMHGISLKLFIPSEIYEAVFRGAPGKVGSRSAFLRWRSADLISMLSRRYLNILERAALLEQRDLAILSELVEEAYRIHDGTKLKISFWYERAFLPRTIINRRGGIEDCFAYMIRHTQKRPRDLMMIMQKIINTAFHRKELPNISAASVSLGVHNDKALEHIYSEAVVAYEGTVPVGLVEGARSVFYERPTIMEGRDLKRFAQELYYISPLQHIEPEEFLQALVKSGVIGRVLDKEVRDGGSELYCKAEFEYVMQGNLAIADRFMYCVHPMMGDLFRMKPLDGRGVVYPMPDRQEDLWLEEDVGIL